MYGLEKELSLKQEKLDFVKGQFQHPDYPSCILLPPERPSSTVPETLHGKIMVHLATRFSSNTRKVTKTMVKKYYIPSQVTQWYKVRRLEGGDDMVADSMSIYAEDRRDATFVRYDLLVDKRARNHRAAPDLTPEHFYGQLKDILVVKFPAAQALGVATESVFILAAIEKCAVCHVNDLEMPVYEKMGALEVVDIGTVQCLVGRIQENRRWTIIDRSGTISRSFYIPGE
ncbi:hypothetical protein PM082_022964 [Marasmius tenuissimus]|nr:hypothetical protein PM082_022964 [Marasmius tenuissimus]